jgi:16S rRNA (uracil1498-N3)-methyltransferase
MRTADTPRIRLFVTASLAPDATLALAGGQAHYLARVMRQGPGDQVALFNGRDGEWAARIENLGRGEADVTILRRLRAQAPEPDVWVAFAPVKKARTDFIVEKATELEASRLLPVATRRTGALRVNTARLAAVATEAAEQCGRLSVPEVAEPEALEALICDWPPSRRMLVLDETGGGEPVARALAGLAGGGAEGPPPVALLAGPEGGFEAGELDALDKLPFAVRVALGPRILRAETAVLAALACWQALVGDWAGDWAGASERTPE